MVALGLLFAALGGFVQHKARAGGIGGEVEAAYPVDKLVQAAFDDAAVVIADVAGNFQACGGAGVVGVFFGGLILAE